MNKYHALKSTYLVEISAMLLVATLPVMVFAPRGDIGHLAVTLFLEVLAIYSLVLWLLQRRQRNLREETIREIQGMLKDIVNNQLAAIALNTELSRPSNEQYLQRIHQSIDTISYALEQLSDEALRDWQIVYDEVETPRRAA